MTIEQTVQSAITHHRAGKRDEAENLYRQALTIDPSSHAVLFLLGALLLELGRHREAAELLSQATSLAPSMPQYHSALGTALTNNYRLVDAAEAFRRAIQLRPYDGNAHKGLGHALTHLGKLDDAIAALEKAVLLMPNGASANADLADAFRKRGRLDDALAVGRRAVQFDASFAWGHNILGLIHYDRGEFNLALASFRQALAHNPNLAPAYINLAELHRNCGQFTQSILALQAAAQLRPDDPEPHNNLGMVLSETGNLEQAIASFQKAIVLRPTFSQAHSSLILALNYAPKYSPSQRFDEHLKWAAQHVAPLSKLVKSHTNGRASGRRLRVGYLSADFRQHPVSYFIEPILDKHDRQKFDIFCYADILRPDVVTDRLRALPLTWRNILGIDDDALAALIRADGIDILVDLGGHTERSRLLVFAQKPAPIQVSYLGYPNTTGMATIDYRLTDAWADPPGAADALHTEKLIRLPAGFLCYSPPKDSPAVGTLPSLARGGAISFGSFNNLAKLTAEAIELWSRILGAVPGSRLLIKNRVSADPKIAAAIVNAFGRHDIDRDRIDVRAPLPTMTEHLQAYGEIDIALDTFPYNGTTTTCEALWMGVPVVALAGNTHAARVGVSILQQVNLSELIAISAEQYVQTAVMLASDSSRLQTMREGLRNRLAASMLLDAAQITGEIESAYLAMWNQWSIRCSIDIPS